MVTTYATFRTSVEMLQRSYEALDRFGATRVSGETESELLNLSAGENANSLEVMNALLHDGPSASAGDDGLARLRETRIGVELVELSADLDGRWRGALFALQPDNPDAARHFCTSAREIFTEILERRVPDAAVKQEVLNCSTTPQGKPKLAALTRYLQQSHLLAHTEGIVDADYVTRTNDTDYRRGQRIVIRNEAVRECLALIEKLATAMARDAVGP